MGMDLRHIRYFVAAVEEGSLQGAAQRLNIAQPALSRRIRDLEASIGCELLLRGARGVTPTRAGASFYRDSLSLLEGVDAARQRTRQLGREEDRLVRLGVIPTLRKYAFLSAALTAFATAPDTVPIAYSRVWSAEVAGQLREGALDMALLYERRAASPGLGERLIHRELYVLALHPSHPLTRVANLTLGDLAGQPLVWLSRQGDADHHDLLLQQCRLHGLEPLIAHSAHGHEEQLDLAVVSGGAFLTPASTMLSTPADMLVFRALPGFAMTISLTLAWRTAVETEPGGALLRALHRAIDRHHEELRSGGAHWAVVDGHPVVALPDTVTDTPRHNN